MWLCYLKVTKDQTSNLINLTNSIQLLHFNKNQAKLKIQILWDLRFQLPILLHFSTRRSTSLSSRRLWWMTKTLIQFKLPKWERLPRRHMSSWKSYFTSGTQLKAKRILQMKIRCWWCTCKLARLRCSFSTW